MFHHHLKGRCLLGAKTSRSLRQFHSCAKTPDLFASPSVMLRLPSITRLRSPILGGRMNSWKKKLNSHTTAWIQPLAPTTCTSNPPTWSRNSHGLVATRINPKPLQGSYQNVTLASRCLVPKPTENRKRFHTNTSIILGLILMSQWEEEDMGASFGDQWWDRGEDQACIGSQRAGHCKWMPVLKQVECKSQSCNMNQ